MKTANLGTPSAKERELVAALTPAERRTLKDPDFITEDEADLIMSDRAMQEGREIPLDDVLKEFGDRRPSGTFVSSSTDHGKRQSRSWQPSNCALTRRSGESASTTITG